MHRYRPEILAELAGKGIHPKEGTDPGRARELVNELYRFEIRDLKLRLKEMEGILGPQPMENYRRQVLELKAKYQKLLGLPAEAWVLPKEGKRMSEIALLLEALDQAYDQRAWHGTNLRGSLRGVSAEQAAWRPGAGRHNVWELALHAAYWKYVACNRIIGVKGGSFACPGSNFFARPEGTPTEKAWKADLALLGQYHAQLRAAVEALDPSRLDERLKNWTVRQTILGAAMHDTYHAGQIQLLKRLREESA